MYTHGQPLEHGQECPFSEITILDSERGARLEKVGAGARLAGSIRTYQDPHWRVVFTLDGNTNTRGFKTEQDALANYEKRVAFLRGLA